jgi:hypothetical protein
LLDKPILRLLNVVRDFDQVGQLLTVIREVSALAI